MALQEETLTQAEIEASWESLVPKETFLRRLRRWPVIPVLIIVVLSTCAIFAPLIAPHSPTAAVIRDRNTPPAWMEGGSTKHLLGADQQGRDVLSRVIHGARVSMVVAAIAISASSPSG